MEEIEKAARKNNTEMGPVTAYEVKVNDMCMKIFEAYNEAQYPFIPGKNYEQLGTNIYNCMSLKNIYRYNLQQLLTEIPTYIPQITKKLEKYKIINENVIIANKNMGNAWEDTHTDNYHTEIRTRIVSDGKNSHMETYTVQVYDNTTHEYDYNKKAGEEGAKNLITLFSKIPTIKLEETIYRTTKTNADGEYAAEKSRDRAFEGKKMTAKELIDIANIRYTGSTILKNIHEVEKLYPKLHNSTGEWTKAKNTAHSETYETTSHSDDGPQEFQIAKNTASIGGEINDNLQEMLQVIKTTNTKVPLLESKIKKFIEVGYMKYASSEDEAKELGDEIITLTKEIYKMNFKEGINVDRFRWGMIFLFALIGGAIGAIAGAGLDYADRKQGLYDKIKFNR